MDRVPLIVVATGVVLVVLVVLFVSTLPWGAPEGGMPAAFDEEGFRAWLSEQEADWTCETSGLRPAEAGPPAGWQQAWLAGGVRVVLIAEEHASPVEAQAAYEGLVGLVAQPLERDRHGEDWTLAVHGGPRGPASVAVRAARVSALVQAEPVDPKRADETRDRAERLAEHLVAWAQGPR